MKVELFEKIRESLRDGGTEWCTEQKAVALASLVIALRPKFVCEIGVWCGASLIPLALAAKSLGRWTDPTSGLISSCKVIAIDPWDAAASAADQLPINAEWWGKAPHEWAYQTFLERLKRFNVEWPVVEVVRKTSDDADPPAGLGILHIDGNHGEQAITDVVNYAPNVRAGGVVILDDFHWEGDAVKRAGEQLEAMGFRALYELDTVSYGRVFQRVGMR